MIDAERSKQRKERNESQTLGKTPVSYTEVNEVKSVITSLRLAGIFIALFSLYAVFFDLSIELMISIVPILLIITALPYSIKGWYIVSPRMIEYWSQSFGKSKRLNWRLHRDRITDIEIDKQKIKFKDKSGHIYKLRVRSPKEMLSTLNL